MMKFYGWSDWPDFFPVKFFKIPAKEMAQVLANDEFEIVASPVQHFIPTIGLRITSRSSHRKIAYSCDTEPCSQVLHLAQDADILFHEASGQLPGHTSAQQAGETAKKAGANSLYLIHYPTGKFASGDPVADARKQFGGAVALATDYMVIDL